MQSAFIRIVSSEIIDFLLSEGFSGTTPTINFDAQGLYGIATSVINVINVTEKYFTIIPQVLFDNINPHITWNTYERIDCGKDIERFKQFCLSDI